MASKYTRFNTTDGHKAAVRKYNDANTIGIHFKLNKKTDKDIIDFLNTLPPELGGKQGFFKMLVREYIERTEQEEL